jgi:hypothetical protein
MIGETHLTKEIKARIETGICQEHAEYRVQ